MQFGFQMFEFKPSEYQMIARACDESLWDFLGVQDAPFYPEVVTAGYPYTPDGSRFWDLEDPVLDPWVAITHMAALTERLRFITAVLRMPIRKPLIEAKAACSVAAVSDERLAGIGIGLGWMPEEFRFTNENMKTRGARADEAIEILRLCLGGGFVEYHGTYYDFDRLIMEPHPARMVPIYSGGHSEPALRRAARLADGWVGMIYTFEDARQLIQRIRQLREEYGRADAPFDIIFQCAEASTFDDFRRLEEIGMTHAWTAPWETYKSTTQTRSQTEIQIKLDAIRRFSDEVIAKFA